MDQYEFENYIEKMKHRRQEGDFKTAAYIANKIDWDYVEDVNLLVFAANIYENSRDYDSAKVLLEKAYTKAPLKNRLYYALCSINIKARNFKEAGNYYFDFCKSFPNDPRKQILKYYYLTARHADVEQRIRVLEEYTEEEKDEEMMYELALLYEKIGNENKMIETCEYIVDFFGVKKQGYGKDALLLKKKHVMLNDTEEALLQDYRFNIEEGKENDNFEMGLSDKFIDLTELKTREQNEKRIVDSNQEINTQSNKNEEYRVLEEDNKKTPVVLKVEREDNTSNENENEKISNNFHFSPDQDSYDKDELENVFLDDTEQKEKLKKMIANIKEEEKNIVYFSKFNEYKKKSFILKERFNNMKIENIKLHMIIEANTKEEGVEIAKSEIEYIHDFLNEKFKIAKVSSYNINDKGFLYYSQKLGNRDLIIENGGRLKDQAIDEIEEFIINKKNHNIIALVDVLNNFDKMANERPSFVERFDIYSVFSEKEQEKLEMGNAKNEKDYEIKPNTDVREIEIQNNISEDLKKEADFFKNKMQDNKTNDKQNIEENNESIKVEINDELMRKALETRKGHRSDKKEAEKNEMTVEEFVEYCKAYTKSIDCVLQGKTIPALYEKVEDLLEEGVKLNETNAIRLIEEAADKAEKPKLFNKPKYDKEGCLILTEDHFL